MMFLLMYFVALVLIIALVGFFWLAYCYMWKRPQTPISLVVNLFALIAAGVMYFQHPEPNFGYEYWGYMWLCLMVVAVPAILCFCFESMFIRELAKEAKLNAMTHVLFLVSAFALIGSCYLLERYEMKERPHLYLQPNVALITDVEIITEAKADYGNYSVDDWGNGGGSFYVDADSVKNVYVSVGCQRIFLESARKDVDYQKLYPIGDTITVYQGRHLSLRN